jgi:hypothetical protein
MTDEINLYHLLAEQFAEAGYPTQSDGASFCFFPLDLALELRIVKENMTDNGCSVFMTIRCTHPIKFPAGITEYATGMAENKRAAVSQAFHNWIICDFTPIHDYLCESGTLLGSTSETACYAGELNEFVAWDIFYGPRIETVQHGSHLHPTKNDSKEQVIVIQTLFQALTDEVFGVPGLYYIRTFMSKYQDGSIQCDCRVNGNDWEHGKESLIQYISQYPTGDGLIYIKQNILLANKPIEEIKSPDLLNHLMDALNKQQAEKQKKWWEIWK